jgi:hypothetical protein
MEQAITTATNIYKRVYGYEPHYSLILHGGLSNLVLKDEDLVIRIKARSDVAFYDSATEYLNLIAASKANLAPILRYFDLATGNLAYNYLPGAVSWLRPAMNLLLLEKLGIYVLALHSLKGGKGEFKAKERFSFWKQQSEASSLNEKDEEETRRLVEGVIDAEPLCYSHNDLVKGNLVALPHHGFRFLDYEFSGLNNEMFDLASLISENGITNTKEQVAILKGYYGKRYEPLLLSKCHKFMRYENYLWFYWAKYRYLQTNEKAFEVIANEKRRALLFNY